MKKVHAWLIGAAVLVVVGAATAWFLYTFEKVADDVRLPPKGEAAINPLYALRAALRANGEAADTQRWFRADDWKKLAARDSLVISGQAAPFGTAEVERLLAWVRGGGHLVVRTGALVESPALGKALGLTVEGEEFDCVLVRAPKSAAAKPKETRAAPQGLFDTGPGPLMLCGATMHGDKAVLAGAAPDGGHRFARIALGAGAVTLVPSMDFLRNRQLESPVARELAYQLLAPSLGRGHFLLVYGDAMPSLWRLMLEHGWPILAPLGLALLAWLAWRSQRFGTLRPVPAAPRRALLEHVQAAGEFAYRRGRVGVLHAALRARFERRVARRDPLLAALDGEARVLALAERCALPAARVRQALAPTELHRPDVFLQSVSTLALMRLRL
jgi:hypothetical protein